jgi:hypothetical protein
MAKHSTIIALFALAFATPLSAQGRDRDKGDDVPAAYRPPPGMCRVWINGVPANKQPAPTDCWTALRDRPPNGRVLFGDVPKLRSGTGRRGNKNDDDR